MINFIYNYVANVTRARTRGSQCHYGYLIDFGADIAIASSTLVSVDLRVRI